MISERRQIAFKSQFPASDRGSSKKATQVRVEREQFSFRGSSNRLANFSLLEWTTVDGLESTNRGVNP